MYYFFFQAEDGIRDWSVTGVQTCALPICSRSSRNGEQKRKYYQLRRVTNFGNVVRDDVHCGSRRNVAVASRQGFADRALRPRKSSFCFSARASRELCEFSRMEGRKIRCGTHRWVENSRSAVT